MRTAYSEYGVGHHRLAAAATPERSLTFNVVHFAIVGGKRALVAANNKISQQVNMLQTLSMYVHTQYDHIPVHVASKDRVDASGDKQRLECLS